MLEGAGHPAQGVLTTGWGQVLSPCTRRGGGKPGSASLWFVWALGYRGVFLGSAPYNRDGKLAPVPLNMTLHSFPRFLFVSIF